MVEKLKYIDYIQCAKRLCEKLKKEYKCDLIIALTHMRIPNEIILAQQVPEIDLILGGHDHVYYTNVCNDVFMMKSGTDFEDFSTLSLTLNISPENATAYLHDLSDSDHKTFYIESKRMLICSKRIRISDRYDPDTGIV